MKRVTIDKLSFFCADAAEMEAGQIYKEIFVNDDYFQCGVVMPDAGTIVDVGANIGLFALRLALHGGDKCRVVAVEALPPTHEILKANVGSLANVKTHLAAVSSFAKAGQEISFRYYPMMPGNSTASTRKIDFDAKRAGSLSDKDTDLQRQIARSFDQFEDVTLKLVTLDSLLDQDKVDEIALLKIDTEGTELDVLQGLGEERLRKTKQIVSEANWDDYAHSIADFLTKNGFKATVKAPDSAIKFQRPNRNVFATRA